MIAALLLAAGLQHWLVVNDIHLNPFSTHGVIRGSDTTPELWRITVPEMRRAVPHPRVVLLGGDMLAHYFPTLAVDAHVGAETAALRTNQTIADDLGKAYPDAQFLVAQGNNDDPCGDYRSEVAGPYARALGSIWQPLVDRHGASPNFMAQFMRGGYYEAKLPIHHGEALVLNSVFWSIVYRGGCYSRPHAPGRAEMAWLNERLSHLPAGTNAEVLLHVPLGYDPESTMTAHRFLAVPFLVPEANRGVAGMLEQHASEIRAIFGAHTHRYDFRVAGGIPMLIGSSISPVYNNNPAFFDVTVDDDGNIRDVVPYAYHLLDGRWEREPSFDAMYDAQAFTVPALQSIARRIRGDAATRAVWKTAYDVWSWRVGDLDNDWVPYSCAQTEITAGYAACAQTTRRTVAAAIAALCAVGAIVLAIVYVALRRRKRATLRR